MSESSLSWRKMAVEDLAAVGEIAALVHPDLPERPEVFTEKLRLFPDGCFVLARGAVRLGYAFAHPWRLNDAPPLDEFLNEIPLSANCLYLHDAVVLPAARGQSAASRLIVLLRALAARRALPALALVSVYGTRRLWRRFGFAVVESPELAGKLACYGASARYMIAPLS